MLLIPQYFSHRKTTLDICDTNRFMLNLLLQLSRSFIQHYVLVPCDLYTIRVTIAPVGLLPILLGTDVGLGFSKHPHLYIQYFWKRYPFISFRWKSWPNHIFHNSVISVINAGEKFTTYWYNGMLNYLHIDIQIDENCIPLIYLTGQKVDPFQRYVCVYQDIGRALPALPLARLSSADTCCLFRCD